MGENKGIRYDRMVRNPENDQLGLFCKYEEILEMVRGEIAEHDAERVLDFGCGTGNLLGPISENIDAYGIDKNIEMMEEGRCKYPEMKFIEGNIFENFHFGEKFNIVTSSYVLHAFNWEDKKFVIQWMISNAKEGGKIILVDYMFKNRMDRERCRKEFLEEGKEELWNFIQGKKYWEVDALEHYLTKKGIAYTKEHITNFTWIVVLEN